MTTSKSVITTTLGALVAAEDALRRLLDVKFDKSGGAKLRYHVMKIARLVAVETAHLYAERNKLVQQFGEMKDGRLVVAMTSEKWPEFVQACDELGAVGVTLNWAPLSYAMLEPYSDISAADLIALGALYDDSDAA